VWLRVDAEGRLGPPPAGAAVHREILDAALRVIVSLKLETLIAKDGSGVWAIVAPLPARGSALGAIAFAMLDSGRRYTTADIDLVRDLLDVARVTTGRIVVERRPVALADIARRALQAFDAAGKTAHHEIVLKTDAVWVIGDASRLEQVVANLLDNALRYTARGGRVIVSVQRDGTEAILRVSDTGRGIPSALLPQIFDLFVRGGGAGHARADGLGLGLTLVRRLVELHGGGVEALSAGEGRGSELIVRLPASAAPAAPASLAVPSTLRPARILIVEDNEDARESLRLLLELDGHEV